MKCVATLKDLWAAEQCNISTNSIRVSQDGIFMITSARKWLWFSLCFIFQSVYNSLSLSKRAKSSNKK